MPKKLTIIVPDDVDFSALTPLLNVALDFQISAVGSKKRGPYKTGIARHRTDKSIIEIIMSHYTHAGEFVGLAPQAWVKQAGYNVRSASPALTILKKNKLISQVGPGRYKFLRPLAPGEKFTVDKAGTKA